MRYGLNIFYEFPNVKNNPAGIYRTYDAEDFEKTINALKYMGAEIWDIRWFVNGKED